MNVSQRERKPAKLDDQLVTFTIMPFVASVFIGSKTSMLASPYLNAHLFFSCVTFPIALSLCSPYPLVTVLVLTFALLIRAKGCLFVWVVSWIINKVKHGVPQFRFLRLHLFLYVSFSLIHSLFVIIGLIVDGQSFASSIV